MSCISIQVVATLFTVVQTNPKSKSASHHPPRVGKMLRVEGNMPGGQESLASSILPHATVAGRLSQATLRLR